MCGWGGLKKTTQDGPVVLSHDERCCFASGICYCSQEQFYCCIQTICCIMLYHDIILWSQMNSFLLVTYRKVHMFSKFCPHLKKLTLLLVERSIVFTVLIFVVLMIHTLIFPCHWIRRSISPLKVMNILCQRLKVTTSGLTLPIKMTLCYMWLCYN